MATQPSIGVAGETLLLTDKGYYSIQSLIAKVDEVLVWNGSDWSKVQIKELSPRHLVNIIFEGGHSLSCSKDFMFLVPNGTIPSEGIELVPLYGLYPGLSTYDQALPATSNSEVKADKDMEVPYLHAVTAMFGILPAKIADIPGPLSSILLNHPDLVLDSSGKHKNFPPTMSADLVVPLNSSLKIKLEWLAGLIDARCYHKKESAVLSHTQFRFIRDIQLLLTTIGVRSSISEKRSFFSTAVENNGEDQTSKENTVMRDVSVTNYYLDIPLAGLPDLPTKVVKLRHLESSNSRHKSLIIFDIVDVGRFDKVYSVSLTDEKQPNDCPVCLLNGIYCPLIK